MQQVLRGSLDARVRSTTWPLLRACHLQPTLAVTTYTALLAAGSGGRRSAVRAGAAALAGQLAVGWSNDYIDRDRDRAAGRLDKPIVAGEVDAGVVRTASIVAASACVPLSLLSGPRAAAVHVAAVASALAYNLRLKGTVASVVPYTFSFAALPVFVTLGGPVRRLPSAAVVSAAALLGAGAHFVNTLPDLESDTSTGITGLPHRLGPVRSAAVGATLLGVSAAVVARTGDRPLGRTGRALVSASAASVAGVVAATATGRARTAWTLALATSGITVLLHLSRGRSI